MKLKKFISLLLCLVLICTCVLPLASCKKKKNNQNNDNPGGTIVGGGGSGTTEYTVRVQTVGGMPMEGVMVNIHKGDGFNICTLPQETDENGITKFTLKTSDDYSVQIDPESVPVGYNVRAGQTRDDRYPLTAPDTLITLASAPITEGGFASAYEVGDIMYDFTLTDIEGNDYKLSELLKTKDMVMLNFWYRDCSNCAQEFPYINSVYDAYKDDIEILAINDYPNDTKEIVESYSTFLNEDLKMPLFKVGNEEDDLTLSKFPSEEMGYPTSIFIDRYGVICMIEVGAVLGDSKWKNIFDHFVGDGYKQQLITDPNILNPRIEPTIQWTDESESQIAGALNGANITVSYHPETSEKDAKYSWPFVVDTHNGEAVVRPSNTGIDNSYATLYAEVSLKPGQAIMFDYFSSTQKDNYGTDVLYILVDGKDIYSIAGQSEKYETCCTFVDPRPVVPGVNDNDVETYSVAFLYLKDTVDNVGDDTVYLKNLRVDDANNIPVEAYIFRYASTDLNETEDGYNTYVDVYLASDGYYRVGDGSKDTDAPLLLANLLSYTHFDPNKTVSERVYGNNYTLMVNGVNMFNEWVIYGNAAANSQIAYHTAVTEELKIMLEAYCDTYRSEVAKADNENLWLQLCVYYDAYGKDKDGNPTKQLANPIAGLTAHSAVEMIVPNGPYTEGQVVSTAEVEYNMVIMPRGYLYKFVPKVSGVYRVTSRSVGKEVNGWIFINDEDWAEQGGDRTMLTSYEIAERFCTDLLIDTNNDGIGDTMDNINTSLVAYMEAGEEYYIDIAYYDVYETGKFEFDVKWVGETYNKYLIQASPGPITYIESATGGMGQLIAGGIDVDFKTEDGVEYAYHVIERNPDGTVKTWGEKIYADFYYPTTLFPSQSIEYLINANAFNFLIDETDREALIILDGIRVNGKNALIEKWIKDQVVADKAAGEAKWTADGINAAIKDFYDGDFDNSYSEAVKEAAEYVWNEGYLALQVEWGSAKITSAAWDQYNMTQVIRDIFYEVIEESDLTDVQKSFFRTVNDDFNTKWADYRLDNVRNGIYSRDPSKDNITKKDQKALEYLEIFNEEGKDALKELWDAEFDSIVPAENENVSDVSEWRFNYLWTYYEMEDVKNGVFHGKIGNYTDIMLQYVEKMENDTVNNPERQGCVAVTRELSDILDTLIANQIFEDVQNGWLKFCFYYNILGV